MEKLGVTKWEHWDGEPYKSSTTYNESVLIPRFGTSFERKRLGKSCNT